MDVYVMRTVSFWKKLACILLLSHLGSLKKLLESYSHLRLKANKVFKKKKKGHSTSLVSIPEIRLVWGDNRGMGGKTQYILDRLG